MSATKTHNDISAFRKPCTLVSVIASFDTTGKTKPLYVRIGEDAYKVHSFSRRPDYEPNMSFYCQVIDGDLLKPLVLQYRGRENVWLIPYEIE